MEVELSSHAQPLGWTMGKAIASNQYSPYDMMSAPEFLKEMQDFETRSKRASQAMETQEPVFQHKYLSSEEALSPMEQDLSDSEDFDSEEFETPDESLPANDGKEPEWAIRVSILSVGPPKVVDVPPSPTSSSGSQRQSRDSRRPEGIPTIHELPSRSSSLANPVRQPATRPPISTTMSDSSLSSLHPRSSESRSSSQIDDDSHPPKSQHQAPRAPISINTNGHSAAPMLSPNSILATPASMTYSFLETDPNLQRSASVANSPVKASHPKRSRLQSIANVARVITKKPKDEIEIVKRSRRGSLINLAHRNSTTSDLTSPLPLSPGPYESYSSSTSPQKPQKKQRMVARGAAEREPLIELPPFPSDAESDNQRTTLKRGGQRLKKRRSSVDV